MKIFIKKYLPSITILLVSIVISGGILFYDRQEAEAQIPGVTFLIGGETMGVLKVCCNGTVLGFKQVEPNPFILSGPALFIPGISDSNLHHTEFLPTFCTLGRLLPGPPVPCLDPGNECSPAEPYPVIWTIGTAGIPTPGMCSLFGL